MNPTVNPEPTTHTRFGSAAELSAVWLLALAVIIAPLMIACAPEWPRLGLEIVMALATILWAVSRPRAPILIAIPVFVCLLFCVQVAPLPDRMLFAIAPISGGAWKAETAIPATAWGSISIDPAASLVSIRRLFLGLATAVTVTSLGRLRYCRKVLTWSLAVTSVLLVIGGLAIGPAKDAKLLWGFVDLSGQFRQTYDPSFPPVMTPFGVRDTVTVGDMRYESISGCTGTGFFTYPYCNLYAGAVVATLPVAIALWLGISASMVPIALRIAISLGVAAAVAWFVSIPVGSRAGGGSLILGSIFLAVLAARGIGRVPWFGRAFGGLLVFSGITLVLATVLAWSGILPGAWLRELADGLYGSRIEPALAGFRMFLASPVMGTGFDTYQLLIPRYQPSRFVYFCAHCDYAQLLAEAGGVGAAIFAAFLVAIFRRFLRFWRDASGNYRVVNAGPWAGLFGLGVHTAFDWNFHIPANAFLGCVLIGLAASSVPEPRPAWRDANRWTISRIVAAVSLVVTCIGVAGLLTRDAVAEHERRRVMRAISMDWAATRHGKTGKAEDVLRESLPKAVVLSKWDPGNARLMLAIGKGYLHLATQPGLEAERADLNRIAMEQITLARTLSPALLSVPESFRP